MKCCYWGWRCKASLLLPLHSFTFHKSNFGPTQFITTQSRRRSHTLSLPFPSPAISAPPDSTPLQGDLVNYMVGQKRATEVAHLVWRHVLRKGDTAVDATCGNGHDTLALLRMVADESGRGCVLGMDIQRDAIFKTASLLDASLTPEEKRLVKLFNMCHSGMEEIVPEHTSVRLVAFNLGYLPGGNRAITTASETTLLALEAAKKILAARGLISLVVYVGHPGGREELETVEAFASGLSVDEWTCSKFQMLNRPLAPVLVNILKR